MMANMSIDLSSDLGDRSIVHTFLDDIVGAIAAAAASRLAHSQPDLSDITK